MVGKFVDLAGFGSVHNPGESLALGAGFFPVHEDAAIIASAAIGSIIEGREVWKVGGAGAKVGVGGADRTCEPSVGCAVPHHLVGGGRHEVAAGDDLPS